MTETTPLPPPEGDEDGYLTQEWLRALRNRPFEAFEAAAFLVDIFPRAVVCLSCASIEVIDDTDRLDRPVKIIKFHTGGWSGAEELIGIMNSHLWIKLRQTVWKRGGHFTYEVSVKEMEKGREA